MKLRLFRIRAGKLAWRPHQRNIVTESTIDVDIHDFSAQVTQTLKFPHDRLPLGTDAKNAALNAMAFTVSVALQSAREFKFLAYATMINAPLTLAATEVAVLWHGYEWTMYGVALGDLIAAAQRKTGDAPAGGSAQTH